MSRGAEDLETHLESLLLKHQELLFRFHVCCWSTERIASELYSRDVQSAHQNICEALFAEAERAKLFRDQEILWQARRQAQRAAKEFLWPPPAPTPRSGPPPPLRPWSEVARSQSTRRRAASSAAWSSSLRDSSAQGWNSLRPRILRPSSCSTRSERQRAPWHK